MIFLVAWFDEILKCIKKICFEDVVDLADSDSSVDGPEDVEEFEDAPESFIIEDDMFIDNVRSTKIQRLSE